MKRRAFYLLYIFLPFIPFAPTEEAWIRNNYTKVEYYIPMRDGTKLFTSIFIPRNNNEKHPILLSRTPYSCAPYGDGKFHKGQWPAHWQTYCRNNYIMVRQDVRGRWMSEGDFMDVRPFVHNKKTNMDIDEASDAYDTIEWLIKNIPSNNGSVGLLGSSYPGFYAAMAAVSGHPAIKAISPQAPVTDWYIGDDFHHNGAFFLADAFNFFSAFGKPRPAPTTIAATGYEFPPKSLYQFYLDAGPLKQISRLMGDSIKFWNEMFAHPDYDQWWKDRDARRAMYQINIPVLVVGGLFDAEDCFGAWNLYKAIEKQNPQANNKIIMGPWSHDQWTSKDGGQLGDINFESNTATWFQQYVEIPFFNHYLKAAPDPKLPEATIFLTGENKWRNFAQWPPAAMRLTPLYLGDANTVAWERPTSTDQFLEYSSDPSNPVPWMGGEPMERAKEYMLADQSFASNRNDVLVFQTPVLEKDLVLAGPVIADLRVSINTTDADFIVKIIDVFPGSGNQSPKRNKLDGYQMLVRGEIMRGRYRHSFENPMPFTPDSIETVKFELPDIAHTFRKGHRLMIQVQSSWFPLADRNPQTFVNIYEANESDFKKAQIRIYHDSTNASNIMLPILK